MASSTIKKELRPKAGSASITIAANSTATVEVVFNNPFPEHTSYAVNLSQSSNFAYENIYIGSRSRTINGFEITASSNRSDSLTFNVMWSAVPFN